MSGLVALLRASSNVSTKATPTAMMLTPIVHWATQGETQPILPIPQSSYSQMHVDRTGTLQISNNELVADGQHIQGGIFRPIALPDELRVTAIIKEGGGDSSVADGNAFSHDFRVLSDGYFEHGYGIRFQRSDSVSNNSAVARVDGSAGAGLLSSTFQFEHELLVDFTIHSDGGINGTVTEGLNTFSFSFGAYNPASTGGNFSLVQPFRSRPAGLNARIDNVVLSSVPEPSAFVRFAAGLSALAGYGRRRNS